MKRIGIMVMFIMMAFLIMGLTSPDIEAEILPLVMLDNSEAGITSQNIGVSVSVTDQIESIISDSRLKVATYVEKRPELLNISEIGIISEVSLNTIGNTIKSDPENLLYAEMAEQIRSEISNDNVEFIYIGDIRGATSRENL